MTRYVQRIRRCAKALLDVAARDGCVDAVRADLAEVRRWLAAPAFQTFAACQRLGGKEARRRAVRVLARAAGLGPVVAEFLVRVEATAELARLGAVLDEFERLWREREGFVRAEIVSARPLAAAQKAAMARCLGVRAEIAYREDPGLLGGFVVRIGERIYDGSVSGRLARLRRRLADAGRSESA